MEFIERLKLPSFHTSTVLTILILAGHVVHFLHLKYEVFTTDVDDLGHTYEDSFLKINTSVFACKKTVIYVCISSSIAHFHRTQHEQSAFACNSRLRSPSLFLYVLLKP